MTVESKDNYDAFRFRNNVNSGDGQHETKALGLLVGCAIDPMIIGSQGMDHSNAAAAEFQMMVPSGPNPADINHVNMLVPVAPLGAQAYNALYSKSIVEKSKYRFGIRNYEIFPIRVMLLPLVGDVYINANDKFNATDLGGTVDGQSFNPLDQSASWEFMKKLPGAKTIRIPAGKNPLGGRPYNHQKQLTQLEDNLTIGEEVAWNPDYQAVSHTTLANPGRGSIEIELDHFSIMNQVCKQLGQKPFDVKKHSDFYPFGGGTGVHPLRLWVILMADSGGMRDFEGTASTADDRYNYIEVENFGSGAVHDWTSRIVVKPYSRQEVVLFDPVVQDIPQAMQDFDTTT